jgi:F0F1-type ATP synthase delta subunit
MRLLPNKIASAVLSLEQGGVEASELAKNLVAFLRRKRSLGLLTSVESSLEKLLDEREGRKRVTVVSAQQLDGAMRSALAEKAQQLFGYDGKKVESLFQEDPKLIGGVKMFTEDTQYDFSLTRILKELKRQL